VDNDSILARVSKLKIQQWRFKAETEGVKHIGPMAQDFREAFGLGEIPTAIATVDADGVAFAAIQGLNDKVEQQSAELKEKETEIAELKTRLEKLERLMTSGK
jgi:trimeric autotransporter adhesin